MYDIVVIGAGAAGLTFVEKTLKQNNKLKICLIDAGDRNNNNLNNFTKINFRNKKLNPVDLNRLFLFGGTTNHWGGYCRPLDPEDFIARNISNGTSWPFKYDELKKFEKEAEKILQLNKSFNKLKKLNNEIHSLKKFNIEEIDFDYSNTEVFSKKFIYFRNKVDLKLNLIAYKLNIDEISNKVINLELIDTKNKHKIKLFAQKYVMATGGIETTRFLLNNNNVSKKNYFNKSKKLGIGFNDHPHCVVGDFVSFDNFHTTNIRNNIRYFKHNFDFQKNNNILNSSSRVVALKNTSDINFELIKEYKNLFTDSKKKILYTGYITSVIEQEIKNENKISLSSVMDDFGIPQVDFKFKMSKLDYKTVRTTSINIAKWLASNNYGRVKLKKWIIDEQKIPDDEEFLWYGHHMGTTPMGNKIDQSVVDKDLKIHGLDNLYILSSSTFPTGGASNPTFTIVQLALRLSSHFSRII